MASNPNHNPGKQQSGRQTPGPSDPSMKRSCLLQNPMKSPGIQSSGRQNPEPSNPTKKVSFLLPNPNQSPGNQPVGRSIPDTADPSNKRSFWYPNQMQSAGIQQSGRPFPEPVDQSRIRSPFMLPDPVQIPGQPSQSFSLFDDFTFSQSLPNEASIWAPCEQPQRPPSRNRPPRVDDLIPGFRNLNSQVDTNSRQMASNPSVESNQMFPNPPVNPQQMLPNPQVNSHQMLPNPQISHQMLPNPAVNSHQVPPNPQINRQMAANLSANPHRMHPNGLNPPVPPFNPMIWPERASCHQFQQIRPELFRGASNFGPDPQCCGPACHIPDGMYPNVDRGFFDCCQNRFVPDCAGCIQELQSANLQRMRESFYQPCGCEQLQNSQMSAEDAFFRLQNARMIRKKSFIRLPLPRRRYYSESHGLSETGDIFCTAPPDEVPEGARAISSAKQ